MAKINIKEIIRSCESDIRHALKKTVEELIPEAKVDGDKLFSVFKHAVDSECSTWKKVSDDLVELEK